MYEGARYVVYGVDRDQRMRLDVELFDWREANLLHIAQHDVIEENALDVKNWAFEWPSWATVDLG